MYAMYHVGLQRLSHIVTTYLKKRVRERESERELTNPVTCTNFNDQRQFLPHDFEIMTLGWLTTTTITTGHNST